MARPWVKFLLIGSLALNLLVAGALAGMAWRGGVMGAGRGGSGQNLFAFLNHLPQERRAQLHKRAGELRPAVRQLQDVVRAAARERADALSAEPFDRQRYVDAQTRQIEADTKLRLLMRDAVAELAGDMTVDERRAFNRWRGQRRMTAPTDAGLDEPAPRRR